MKLRGIAATALIGMVFFVGAPLSSAWAKGNFYIRDLRNAVAFSRGAGITTIEYLPEDLRSIVDRSEIAYDLQEAFQRADSGSLNAYADPAWRSFLAIGDPSLSFTLEDHRGWGNFFTQNMLGVVHLYDRFRDRFVRYSIHASSWGVSDIRVSVTVDDGGRYDMDGTINGRVRVGIAVGAGITAESDFTGSLLGGGGCSLGSSWGSFLLLLPIGGLWRHCRRGLFVKG